MVDRLLRVPQVARMLRVSQRAVRGMIRRRQLAAVRLGRRIYVRAADLDAALVPYDSKRR